MTFSRPEFFLLLLVLPLLAWAAIGKWRDKKKRWSRLVAPRLQATLIIPASAKLHFLQFAFLAFAFAFLIAALSGPHLPEDGKNSLSAPPRSLLLGLDVSRSMSTPDTAPSRLEKARPEALQIAAAFPDDELGLLIFSGEALLLVPPTTNHAVLRESLLQTGPGYLPIGGSDLPAALRLARETLSNDHTHSPALILLTDGGEDLPQLLPEGAAFAAAKIPIHVLAYGTSAGALIPDPEAPDQIFRDREGRPVLSRLNEGPLRELAEDSGGVFSGGLTPDFLKKIAHQTLSSTSPSFLPEPVARPLFQWFLLPAILFLSLALLPPVKLPTSKKNAGHAMFAGLLFLPDGMSVGEKAFREGNWPTARSAFETVARKQPPETAAPFHLSAAAAAYRSGNFKAALESYALGLLSDDSRLQTEARFSMGNCLYQLGLEMPYPEKKQAWEEAIRQYQAALEMNSDHRASSENLAFLKNELAKLPPPESPEAKAPPPGSEPPPANGENPETPEQSDPPKTPENPENPNPSPDRDDDPETSEPSIESARPAETPEQRARRILEAHADPGTKPPDIKNPLTRPEKDW